MEVHVLEEEDEMEEFDYSDFKAHPTLEPYMISKLKFKCSITLFSMVESRANDDIVIRMNKSLPEEMIKRNLMDNYLMYKDLYGDKYTQRMFEHIYFSPDDGYSKYECSFIIQTAFYLYIIYRAFRDIVKKNDMEVNFQDPEGVERGVTEHTEALKFIQSCYLRAITKSPRGGGEGVLGRRPAKYLPRNNKKGSIGEQEVKNDILVARKESEADCLKFFNDSILSVEVVRADGQLEKAYFSKLPYFDAINKDIKQKFNLISK